MQRDETATQALVRRSRSRVTSSRYTPAFRAWSDGSSRVYTLPCQFGSSLSERITDESPHYSTYGYVDHEKTSIRDSLGPKQRKVPTYFSWDSQSHKYTLRNFTEGDEHGHWEWNAVGQTWSNLYPGYPGTPTHPWSPSSISFSEQLCEDLFKEIIPKVDSEISLPNFLLELRDLKSIVTGPGNIARKLVRQLSAAQRKKAHRKAFLLSARALLSAGGSIILQDAYVNKTSASDISTIVSTAISLRDRLERLWSYAGKVIVGHASKRVRTVHDSITNRYSDSNDVMESTWSGTSSGIFTVTVKYRYQLVDMLGSRLSKEGFELLGKLDAYGINLNPGIIWDAIPFSFILDWIVDIQGWLESLRVDNVQAAVEILDACWSLKTNQVSRFKASRQYAVRQHQGPAGWIMEEIAWFDTTLITDHYHRERFVPRRSWCGALPSDLSSPSWRQWLIAASLLVSK